MRTRTLEERTIHAGRRFDFVRLTLAGSDGEVFVKEGVRHPGAVCILPLIQAPGARTRVVLIRNERVVPGKELVEIPAGTREPGEPPDLTAGRELEEETGYRAATLRPLGRFYTTPGLTDELMWAYVATGLTHVGQRLESDEHLTVSECSIPEVLAMLDDRRIEDAKTMLTLLLAVRAGLLSIGE